jgi:hypothetical protein
MNKKEKKENITQIVETIELEVRHHLYDEINECIFDRNLAKESFDGRYAPIFGEIYNKVIDKLNNFKYD